jgi:hypothetical protein
MAFLSLREGFGLPFRKRHGVSAVEQLITSLSEVGGPAALYLQNGSAGDLWSEIESLPSTPWMIARWLNHLWLWRRRRGSDSDAKRHSSSILLKSCWLGDRLVPTLQTGLSQDIRG